MPTREDVKKLKRQLTNMLTFLRRKTKEAPPLIIAGGLGSGKIQLLYHLFKYSWRDL